MKAFGAAALLLVLAIGAQAQLDEDAYAPLSNIPPAAEGVDTVFWFPEHTNLQFPAGDSVEAILGLHSSASETFNITAIFGSLNNPEQFSMFFYNFTPQAYQRTLRSGEELSLSYQFYVPYNLPAREFQVALTVFYTNEQHEYHASTFFNRTIDVVEKPKWVDTELLFLYLLLAAGVATAGYFAYSYISGLGFVRSRKSKRGPKRTTREVNPDGANADEWLKGTNFAQAGARPRKSTSGKDIRKTTLQQAAASPTPS